jgi:cell division topological specificity factor
MASQRVIRMNKIKRFFQRAPQSSSRDTAKQRLQLVLVHDRNQIEPGMLEIIKDEIIAVISKHIDIDPTHVQVNFSQSERENKLVADIPLTPRRPTRK